MQAIQKICAALVVVAGVLIATEASAANRPAYCAHDHDHRAHDANYYDYYDADRYFRAGDYRPASRYDRRGGSRYNRRYDRRGSRHYHGRRGYHRPRSEVVFRRDIDLRRYHAYVTVVEENYWTRSGRVQRVCSIVPKGRNAYDVPHRSLARIARNNCSRYARVQYL